MSGERMNESQMAALVTEWNERYRVGTDVVIAPPSGKVLTGTTTAPAAMLDNFARVRVGEQWWPLEWVTPASTEVRRFDLYITSDDAAMIVWALGFAAGTYMRQGRPDCARIESRLRDLAAKVMFVPEMELLILRGAKINPTGTEWEQWKLDAAALISLVRLKGT